MERLSKQVLPLFPFGSRDRGLFLLTCSKVHTIPLKGQGHACWLMLSCVTAYLGCPSWSALRDMGHLVEDRGTVGVKAASAETEDWKKGIEQV